MVFVWSYLTDGDAAYTLVQVRWPTAPYPGELRVAERVSDLHYYSYIPPRACMCTLRKDMAFTAIRACPI